MRKEFEQLFKENKKLKIQLENFTKEIQNLKNENLFKDQKI